MAQWTPEEISAHLQYMNDFAARLEKTGEFVARQALAPSGRSSATTGRAPTRRATSAEMAVCAPRARGADSLLSVRVTVQNGSFLNRA